MKSFYSFISIIFVSVLIVGCGGGGGSGSSDSSSVSSMNSSSSSSSFPMLPTYLADNPQGAMQFFLDNAPVDLREMTNAEAWEYGEDFGDAWFHYHNYHAPKTIIENWVTPDHNGTGLYPLRIDVDGNVSYLVVSKIFTADNIYRAMLTSVNFMQDDVDKGDFCYVDSIGEDVNASINQSEFNVGAGMTKVGTELEYIPAYDNSMFGDVQVPKAPKLKASINGKDIVFFFNSNKELDYQDGRYVIGVYYNGTYHTEEEYLLAAEANDFRSQFYDVENGIAINLRTTRFDEGAVNGFTTARLSKCDVEPITRSGLKLDRVYETPFNVEGVVAKAYIHIAEDGLVSAFTDDILNWDNCLNTGELSRKNGQMDGVYAYYNRDGNYILIKDKSFRSFRFILGENGDAISVQAFDHLGTPYADASTSFVNELQAISTNLSSTPVSDLEAAVCSPQQ